MPKHIVHVKALDFKTLGRINPHYSKGVQAWTWYAEGKNPPRIDLDKNLPERTRTGRQIVLYHELCHVKIKDLGIKIKVQQEELYCDFEGLIRTNNRHLCYGEQGLKRLILGHRRWHRKTERYGIIEDILLFLNINMGAKEKRMLADYRDR